MRNKFNYTILILLVIFGLNNISYSQEVFNFDVKEIEIKENGNLFLGRNGGTATSNNGIIINAINFNYNKSKNILTAVGDVKIFDPKVQTTIYSNKIIYYKNKDLIVTDGKSKAIDESVEIDAVNFEYNKLENIIIAEGNVKINNKKEKYKIFSDKIIYYKNKDLIVTDGKSKAIDESVEIDAVNFEYNKLENIIIAEGNVKINNKKEKYKIFSDKIIYNRSLEEIFARNNSKVISNEISIEADVLNFYQKSNLYSAEGNARFEDKKEELVVKADRLLYNKLDNKIITKGITDAVIDYKYEFLSKDVYIDKQLKIISSDNSSTIKDDNLNTYKLSKFKYFYEKKFLKGNNIEVETNYKSQKSDKFYFDNAFINFSDNSYIAKNTKVKIHKDIFDKERDFDQGQENIFKSQNDPRIYGSSSSGNDDVTVLNKAIFTSCKINDNCPPWSIKADKITHDKLKKNILYDNAILNLYDVPVFYFPKFFHPDPSVERRSGLLQPRLNNSNILGSSINIPYFHVISDNKDLTFKPTLFDNKIYMFQNEFRQKNKNSSFIADFSYIKGYQSKDTDNTYNNRNSISHIFSKFDLDLGLKEFTNSKLKVFLEKVNNDTYLKVFENVLTVDKDNFEEDLKDKNNLTSGLELALDKETYNFTTGFTIYENLQKKKNDRYQQVLPYYDFSKSLFSNENGKLDLKSSGRNTLQNTNNLRTTVTNTVEYRSTDLFFDNGFVNNFGIYFKNLNATGKKDTKYKSSTQSEILNIYEFNSKLPLYKESELNAKYITPKLSFRINPSDMKNYKSESRLITTDNVFDINRLGISDSYEAGKSLTFGFDYKNENKEDLEKYFEFKLAGVLRDGKEEKIPTSSSLNRTSSNLFGSVENSFSDFFSLNYDFAIDNDFSKFEHNAIEAEFKVNNFVTSFNFLEKAGETGDVNMIENTSEFIFDQQNSLLFKTRRNRKISLTEYYDLVYQYQNDCLTAGIKYRKTYYQDRDLKPKEDLFFTITLFPLTSLDQKIDESIYRN